MTPRNKSTPQSCNKRRMYGNHPVLRRADKYCHNARGEVSACHMSDASFGSWVFNSSGRWSLRVSGNSSNIFWYSSGRKFVSSSCADTENKKLHNSTTSIAQINATRLIFLFIVLIRAVEWRSLSVVPCRVNTTKEALLFPPIPRPPPRSSRRFDGTCRRKAESRSQLPIL